MCSKSQVMAISTSGVFPVASNAFLARIGVIDSPICPACQVPETPAHFLLTCSRFVEPQHALRVAINGPLSLCSVLGEPKSQKATIAFVRATGRFASLLDPQE